MTHDLLWEAPAAQREGSALWHFAQRTQHLHGAAPDDYAALHAWSIREPQAYYTALWDELDVIGQRGERCVTPGPTLRETRFFADARLNYAENLLREADARPAMIVLREDGRGRSITRAELAGEVSRFAQALRAEGIGTGDRVAAIVTHDIEALVGYLACASIGAIWSSCSPDFGPEAASDRLGQIAPLLLLAVTDYHYGGKQHDVVPSVQAVAQAATPRRVVLIAGQVPEALGAEPCVTLDDWLQPFAARPPEFAALPFDTPLAILYSSGTTGKPKAIVHSAGGLLIQHLKELRLHCDLGAGERFFYFTTCGWMMWNWQVSALALGAVLVSYDGNPFTPGPARLLDLCEAEPLHVFGTSARYLDACARAALVPRETHELGALRLILSTGSPLQAETFDYVYRDWKRDVHLASISGGTDICGCFLGGNPLLPVRRGELQCALLGMDVVVLDEQGQARVGQNGELVCRNAHPSQPLGFWGDVDGSRYQAAYFARFPGVWTHGDYAEQRPSGGFVIHGRSDTTLNPGGVRIGTAEIYRQLDVIPEVLEAMAVGQQHRGDERILLFLRLRDGMVLDDALQQRIRNRLRQGASPRHVPACMFAVDDFPRTRSGKLSESAVREVVNGRPVKNAEALANAQVLEQFYPRST